jgi:rhodanese-related sulfurtransferase
MDKGCFSISATSLYQLLGGPAAPILIDVRRTPTFDADPWMIVGAIRRPPEAVAQWGRALPKDRPVVVYCAHGREISRHTAASLRGIGLDARFLEGGIGEWAERKLPLLRKRDDLSCWVTRERPKIDRIACPWLIRRFIGPDDYYIARANALEDNLRFYRVVKGRREQLQGANLKVASNQWHSLGLRAEGDRFTVSFDGKPLFTAQDKTFSNPGKMALWTKADSVTHFDRMSITPLE